MRRLILVLCVASLFLTSCHSPKVITTVDAAGMQIAIQPSQNRIQVSVNEQESFSVYSGRYDISYVFSGVEIKVPMLLGNDTDSPVTLELKVREPDSTVAGYKKLPKQYLKWITLGPEYLREGIVEVLPGESRSVCINIAIPDDATYQVGKEEVWVSIIDKQQKTLYIEICSRLLLTGESRLAPAYKLTNV